MHEQTKGTATFILNMLQNNCQLSGRDAENLVAAKQWLMAIMQGDLVVNEAPKPPDKK